MIKGKYLNIAIILVYMAVDNPQSRKWNDKLEQKIAKDIHSIKAEGVNVILIGDFNGYIRDDEDGGLPGGDIHTDINGQMVLNLCQKIA